MAAGDITLATATQIRFLVAGSFSPVDAGTNWTVGTPTDVVLTLAGVLDGAARQSTKFDFGENRAESYALFGCLDYTGETPALTGTIDYYLAPTPVSTQANGNVAGNSGADADAPGGALNSIALAEFLRWCDYIGSLPTDDGAGVQNGYVDDFKPPARYAQLILVNNGGDAFENDDVEMHQVMNPILRQQEQ